MRVTFTLQVASVMKFCAYLKTVEEDAPPSLHGKFLTYKQLKKFLKYRVRRLELAARGAHAGGPSTDLRRSTRQQVLEMLQEQLCVIDRYES